MKGVKKKKGLKISGSIKKWRLGDYFRQLSAIIIGVVITFIGSDLINSHYKQKEVTSVMHLIKTELERNQEHIREVGEKIIEEERIIKELVKYNFDYTKIPVDTLSAYKYFINVILPLEYGNTSLEVLRNSALMQHVSDKEFLLKLTLAYDKIEKLARLVDEFYDRGEDAWKSVFAKAEIPKMISDDPAAYFNLVLENEDMRKYMVSVAGYFTRDSFQSVYDRAQECIQYIEKEYH